MRPQKQRTVYMDLREKVALSFGYLSPPNPEKSGQSDQSGALYCAACGPQKAHNPLPEILPHIVSIFLRRTIARLHFPRLPTPASHSLLSSLHILTFPSEQKPLHSLSVLKVLTQSLRVVSGSQPVYGPCGLCRVASQHPMSSR